MPELIGGDEKVFEERMTLALWGPQGFAPEVLLALNELLKRFPAVSLKDPAWKLPDGVSD